MSNNFNTSVAPEIAALDTKIDTIDAVVDAIRATDVVNLTSALTAVQSDLDGIRDADLPTIIADIYYNETKIFANKTILDNIYANQPFFVEASDDLIASSDAEGNTTSTPYIKVKEIKLLFTGIYRISFDIRKNASGSFFGLIYRNDAAYGTERTAIFNSYVTFSEDLFFHDGDLLQLYVSSDNADATYYKNFRLYGIKGPFPLSATVLL